MRRDSDGAAGNDAMSAPSSGSQGAPCAIGATRCADNAPRVEICLGDGRWVDKEPCASFCEDGACVGGCLVGERRCGKHQTPQLCDSTGHFADAARCPAACVGEGMCVGECVPGSRRCGGADGLTPEQCNLLGQWNAEAHCAFVCSDGACGGACAPGSRRCGDDGRPELCGATGTFAKEPACPFVCTGDGACGGECSPGAIACDANTPRTCDASGQWRAGVACVNQACVDGRCVGQCEPGSRACRADMLATCDASGQLQNQLCDHRCVRDHCAECASDADCPGDALCQDEHCVALQCFGAPINGQGTGQACCDARCGAAGFELTATEDPDGLTPESKGCGQPNCGHSRAGPTACCTATIRVDGQSCKEKRSAPCWLSR